MCGNSRNLSVEELKRTVPVTVRVSVTTGVSVDVEVPILKQEHAAETWEAG